MRRAILGTITTATACSALAFAAPVEREGRGERREALNQAETTPFDFSALAGLKDWANGSRLTAEEAEGAVVVLVTIDATQPGTLVMGPMIERLQRAHADEDLIVVALHPREGWDQLQRFIESGMIDCRVARDSVGAVRKSLDVDDDPDVYVIDRAGQLRYADISNSSVSDAVEELLAETPEHARGEAQRRTTQEGRIAAGLEEDPAAQQAEAEEAELPEIPPAMYAKADWPRHNGRLSAKNYQGERMPAELGNEKWLSDKVETEGKVLVLDFWATWCGPCKRASPTLDKLQKKMKDEVAVLAISGSREDAGVVKRYLRSHKASYSYLHDDSQKLSNAFGVRGIPHTVVISTDGVVRWQGNPLNRDFTDIVKQIAEADPMVKELAERRAKNGP